MRLYTGQGDSGSTDLLGARVEKDDPRIELLGTLDETTSSIGFARSLASKEIGAAAIDVQRDLYRIMAELAFTDELRPDHYHFAADRVAWLERLTDQIAEVVHLPPHFVVPGDTVAGAAFDVARTVARRAERQAVALNHTGTVSNLEILRYLNRLSSLLFIMARAEDAVSGEAPIKAKTGTRE
jgi:cob(I)alamin adenosyltransferase